MRRKRPIPSFYDEVVTDVDALWRQFKTDGLISARDKLVEHYAYLARTVASKVGAGLPANVEMADLVSDGMIGLLDAVNKFDLSRNIKFETYAAQRIKGAIIDELRSIDWVPRSVRQRARKLQTAATAAETRLGRTPTEQEVADELDSSVSEVREIQLDTLLATINTTITGEPETDGGTAAAVPIVDFLPDEGGEAPDDSWFLDAFKTAMDEALQSLKGRERVVAQLYYKEGLTLAEIGEHLGVTESRVCQLHTKATQALQVALVDPVRR